MKKSRKKTRRIPKGAGCYHSGRSDISQRAEELLFQKIEKQYRDFNLGFAYASVMATAERLNVYHILTIDERDFRAS